MFGNIVSILAIFISQFCLIISDSGIHEACDYNTDCTTDGTECILSGYALNGRCECESGRIFNGFDGCIFLDQIEEPCVGVDRFNVSWIGIRGFESVQKCCHIPGHFGSMTWACGLNGEFHESGPNYTQCSTQWIYQVQQNLDKAIFGNGDGVQFPLGELQLNPLFLDFETSMFKAENEITLDAIYFGFEMEQLSNWVQKLSTKVVCGPSNFAEKYAKKMASSIQSIMRFEKVWKEVEDSSGILSILLNTLEGGLADFITNRIPQSEIDVQGRISKSFSTEKNDGFYAEGTVLKIDDENQNIPQIFPSNYDFNRENYVILPGNFASNFSEMIYLRINETNTDTCLLNKEIKILYNFIEAGLIRGKFQPKLLKDNGEIIEAEIMSDKFASLTIQDDFGLMHRSNLNGENVTFRFKHEPVDARKNFPICAFWDYENLIWSTEGCSIVNDKSDQDYSTCECNHLSSFAMLMGEYEIDEALFYISLALSSLSAICYLITFLTLQSSRDNSNFTHTRITCNICACLFFGNILLIFLNPALWEIPDWLCGVAGIGTHYFFLAAFLWMALMGGHLFKMITRVFDTGEEKLKFYILIGYILPGIYVAITAGIGRGNAYNLDQKVDGKFCWLKGDYIWTFLAPAALIICVNLGILFYTIIESWKVLKDNKKMRATKSNKRINIIGWISFSFLLGINWIFGYFTFIDDEKYAAYIFTILNASQGIFLLAFNLYMKKAFRADILKLATLTSSTKSRDWTKSSIVQSRGK